MIDQAQGNVVSQERGLQLETCRRFGADFVEADPQLNAGVAENLGSGLQPINGLRHPPQDGTTGWFLWAGEVFSEAGDFFKPLCVRHLGGQCRSIVKYLGLPPGWRFLIADDYEDVWFDPSLLDV